MQTAREERLQKLALAYRDVEWLGTRWYWNVFLFITVGDDLCHLNTALLHQRMDHPT